jgi:(p)ppGpp synthase/HD superfamily hydrolase
MEIIAALNVEEERDGNLAVQCAILHDVIEDTNVSFDQVKEEFGLPVADGVLALTKDESLAKDLQISDSLRRIKEQPAEIWMVKLADRISNLLPPPQHWTQAKITRYREDAVEIYETLKDASPFLAARLVSKIENYKQFIK